MRACEMWLNIKLIRKFIFIYVVFFLCLRKPRENLLISSYMIQQSSSESAFKTLLVYQCCIDSACNTATRLHVDWLALRRNIKLHRKMNAWIIMQLAEGVTRTMINLIVNALRRGERSQRRTCCHMNLKMFQKGHTKSSLCHSLQQTFNNRWHLSWVFTFRNCVFK